MHTSTNMQSSTHLPLLVAVVVMVERMKPLPHPGSPPTEDVMPKREKKRKGIKAKCRPVRTLSEKTTCLDRVAFFRSGSQFLLGFNMLLLLLQNSQFSRVLWSSTVSKYWLYLSILSFEVVFYTFI